MSGPGWMPSRPRPLVQARRRLVSYFPRRTARRARTPNTPTTLDAARAREVAGGRLFGRRAKLPVATLLPQRSRLGAQRDRVIAGSLHEWMAHRWQWLRPRMIPLVFAFVGLVGMLNARRYLLELARGPVVNCGAPDETRGPYPERLGQEPVAACTDPARLR